MLEDGYPASFIKGRGMSPICFESLNSTK
jgi:hypothetical protein